jgi:glycosyltransferase 2 family protein
MLSLRLVKLGLLLLGLIVLISLVAHIGPSKIYSTVASVGGVAIIVILVPSAVMYVLDCHGWRFTLGQFQTAVPFPRLFMIRAAGEFVNATTPTVSIGGEPLKASLLKRYSIPMGDGLASVIVAKTTMTIAQIAYALLGVGLGIWLLIPIESTRSEVHWITATALAVMLLLFLVALFVVVQRQGIFSWVFRVLEVCRIHVPFLEARRIQLFRLDASIAGFYTRERAPFLFSTTAFFCGWLVQAVEVYVVLRCLGEPVNALTAISIDALSTLIKGGGVFIPGSVGVQEGGMFMLLRAYGHSDVTGITFALLRRLRELLWIAIGVICLAILMRGESRESDEYAAATSTSKDMKS